MRNVRKTVTSLIPAACALLLTVGVLTVFSACGPKEDGTWMHCHEAQTAAALLAAALTCAELLIVYFHRRNAQILLHAAGLILCVILFLLPGTLISLCMMRTMRCYTAMQPFVRIMAALTGCFHAVSLIRVMIRGRKDA